MNQSLKYLDEAAFQNDVSETVYVELALKDRFKKDAIK